ncbi:MAG: CapA family protein [Bacteroidetes bacterium]|nr:CapA family protein [Bacteroidota bacterium]
MATRISFLGALFFAHSFFVSAGDSSVVRLLCLGDINLGRTLGQRLLQGDTGYPFAKIKQYWSENDIVFANLESVISDQGGETVSPHSNVVFCAPPVAANVLQAAHVSIVSLANNHVFDYGVKGINDAVRYLDSCRIAWVGLVVHNRRSTYLLEKNGITFGFAAYTSILNFQKGKHYVSLFDSVRIQNDMQWLKSNADFIVASYHGGREYSDDEDTTALGDMEFIAKSGANIVVGHHPHVPLGIHKVGTTYILSSLGNCIFNQPQHSWTKYGLIAEFLVSKSSSGIRIASLKVIPIRAGYQPHFVLNVGEREALVQRLKYLSTVPFQYYEKGNSIEVVLH